jgi:hypothetical protein
MGEYEITISLVYWTKDGDKDNVDYVHGYGRALADLLETKYGDQIDIEEIKVRKV